MENSNIEKPSFIELNSKLTKIAGAFAFDEKLQRIVANPMLVPHDLNTLNAKFIGPLKPSEDVIDALYNVISKYAPQEINRETILTTNGILNLRKLSLLVNLAGDLDRSKLDIAKMLREVDGGLSSSQLDPLISSEEMYRVRSHEMHPSVANFPQKMIDNNPQLKLDPAYDKFIQHLNSEKSIEEASKLLGDEYPSEHTLVTFKPVQGSGLKPVYGLVDA